LGPRGLRSDDRVVLLVGARVPFTVRTEDEEKEWERYEADGAEREETTEKGQDGKSGEKKDKSEKEVRGELSQDGRGVHKAREQETRNQGGIESHSSAALVAVAGAGIQVMTLGKKDDTILVGETYVYGLDEWLQSEDSKNLEESKVAFTLV
jgi:hypothetical protein